MNPLNTPRGASRGGRRHLSSVTSELPGSDRPASETSDLPTTGRPATDRRLSAVELRAMWRTISQDSGWSHPSDWWCPGVDAVTESVVSDGDILERCRSLGLARAGAGVPMKETLDDVLAFGYLVRSLAAHPSLNGADRTTVDIVRLLQVTAEGWAEQTESVSNAVPGVEEPLTQLVDLSYLAVRLGEVYAEAEYNGQQAKNEYALVVASLIGPQHEAGDDAKQFISRVQAWDQLRHMTQVADHLKSVFASGETIALAGTTTAVVLVRRTPELPGRIGVLRELFEGARLSRKPEDLPAVGVWVEGLPGTLHAARELLSELKR